MTAAEWVLGATVFFSGLASGLLGMLSTIMRPMLAEMEGRDFRTSMEAFLRSADHSLGKLFNLAWALGMFLLPIAALVLLWDDRGSTPFVLTAIGAGIVLVGVIVLSNAVKTPHYAVMLAWDPEAMPPGWEAGRQKYFTINWIQMATTWSAFALFIVALVLLWDDRGSTAFVLTAIGLVIVVVGVIVLSNAVKTPHYKVMLVWDPEAMPPDWKAGRQKYFTINWIQMATTWSAFALFIAALIAL